MREDQQCRAAELQKSGKYQEALDAYRALADTAPNNNERAAALIWASDCLGLLGKLPEARECLHEASRIMDHTPESRTNMAYLDAMLDASTGADTEALAKLDDIVGQFGDILRAPELRYQFEKIQIQRAYSLLNLGRPREALPIFLLAEKYEVEKPDDFTYRHAYCLAACGQARHGESLIRESLAKNLGIRQETEARYYLGLIFVSEGRHADAMREFEFCESHLNELEPNLTDGLFSLLGSTSERVGLKDRALRYRRMGQKQ